MTRRLCLNNCNEHNIFNSIKNKYPDTSVAIQGLVTATVLHTGVLAFCQTAKAGAYWHKLYDIAYMCN